MVKTPSVWIQLEVSCADAIKIIPVIHSHNVMVRTIKFSIKNMY